MHSEAERPLPQALGLATAAGAFSWTSVASDVERPSTLAHQAQQPRK